MAFNVPSLPALVDQVQGDLAVDPLRQSDAVVVSRAVGGVAFGLYGYLQWIARQILPDTADEETLERDADLRLEVARRPAVAATGPAQFQAMAGALLDAGTLLQSQDGRRYRVAAAVNTTAGANTAALEAVTPGAAGNLAAGVELRLVSPVLGVVDGFTVQAPGVTGGTDQESVESLRERVVRSYRVIPHGGDADDYVTWALEVPGITRAWVVRNLVGLGTVGVFAVRDNDPSIAPDASELAALQAHLEIRRPVTAEVYAMAPTLVPVTFSLSVRPDSLAIRAAVEANLRDLVAREAELGGKVLLSHIRAAISAAAGENDYTLASPSADLSPAALGLLTFGGCVWL